MTTAIRQIKRNLVNANARHGNNGDYAKAIQLASADPRTKMATVAEMAKAYFVTPTGNTRRGLQSFVNAVCALRRLYLNSTPYDWDVIQKDLLAYGFNRFILWCNTKRQAATEPTAAPIEATAISLPMISTNGHTNGLVAVAVA